MKKSRTIETESAKKSTQWTTLRNAVATMVLMLATSRGIKAVLSVRDEDAPTISRFTMR